MILRNLLFGVVGAWYLGTILGDSVWAWVAATAVAVIIFTKLTERIATLDARLEAIERLAQINPPGVPASEDAATHTPAPTSLPGAAAPSFDTRSPSAQAQTADAPILDLAWGDTTPGVMSTPADTRQTASDAVSAHMASSQPVDETSLSVVTSIGRSLNAWFRGGNTIVRIGILILFIGVGFLLRYASEHTHVPIEVRFAGVAMGGMALVGLGWRLRHARHNYALSLQGGGIGVMYLTVFAAFRLYHLVPAGLAFALLVGLALANIVLATRQNAMILAVIAFVGAFLAPVVASSGHGSHVALFSYTLILNLAIARIAWNRPWKPLNVLGFLFTFGLASSWGALNYQHEHFATAEPFLLAHFLLYLFISLRYTQQLIDLDADAVPAVDATLLFGVPFCAFGMQAGMLKGQPLALAFSAAALSGVYLLMGRWLWRRSGERLRLMTEGMLTLGLIFMALVMPLALDARWTSAAWALQGAGVVWIGLRQRRVSAIVSGLVLQIGSCLSLAVALQGFGPGDALRVSDPIRPFFNSRFLAVLILVLSWGTSARNFYRAFLADRPFRADAKDYLSSLHWICVLVALAWWLGGASAEFMSWRRDELDLTTLMLLHTTATGILCMLLSRPLQWPTLRLPARALVAISMVFGMLRLVTDASSGTEYLWAYVGAHDRGLAFLVIALCAAWLYHRLDRDDAHPSTGAEWVLYAWFLMLSLGLIPYALVATHINRDEGWSTAVAVLLPTLLLLTGLHARSAKVWPFSRHIAALVRSAMLPWLTILLLWSLLVNARSASGMAPLPYLPLFNPVDLMHGLALVYAVRVLARPEVDTSVRKLSYPLSGLTAWWWGSSVLVRSLHHWASTPLWLDGALDSGLVQTSLTILWTIMALCTMLWATRQQSRRPTRLIWVAGASLLGLVVVKLFLVDLSHVDTLQRIVSFLGVGVLMLLIGYISPIPPARTKEQS